VSERVIYSVGVSQTWSTATVGTDEDPIAVDRHNEAIQKESGKSRDELTLEDVIGYKLRHGMCTIGETQIESVEVER
jgi:propanediol dehydratase small subunit